MKSLAKWFALLRFGNSRNYWETRYALGGDSGTGSGGATAEYKASVLNRFVEDNRVASVIEFGCGDGRQLALANFAAYVGIDVSAHAVERCRATFSGDESKRFEILEDYRGEKADLSLSLDVLYHLVEDATYFDYLDRLFSAAGKFVGIYSTSTRKVVDTLRHVRHRDVEGDIARRFPEFQRMADLRDPEPVDRGAGSGPTRFFFYSRL